MFTLKSDISEIARSAIHKASLLVVENARVSMILEDRLNTLSTSRGESKYADEVAEA
jgi:hypothetical protein